MISKLLTELDSKFTSLAKQNEWIKSKSTSNINSKYMAMSASADTSSDIIQLLSRNLDILKVLIASLKQKADPKNNPN